ncbi:putative suppressor protein SRP40-like isoform X2 [Capsicum annuum]|nr:putative suppressor protein SRP40-like isoform X2 [Capsicum annuum]
MLPLLRCLSSLSPHRRLHQFSQHQRRRPSPHLKGSAAVAAAHLPFLKALRMVLSASDAGRIGRLVLPKACAENEFERKKQEILAAQSSSAVDGETNSASQPAQLSEMDIWVQSVGGKKKKEESKVLTPWVAGRSVKATNSSTSTLPKEFDEMIKSLNILFWTI